MDRGKLFAQHLRRLTVANGDGLDNHFMNAFNRLKNNLWGQK